MKIQTFLLLGALTAVTLSAAEPPIDIVTRDGRTYRSAVVEGVNPSGIDIGYVNEDGTYALKGIPFANLPDDLQKRFGYDPAAAAAFERRVQAYRDREMSRIAEEARQRRERIIRDIKEKFAGGDISISPEDLRFAIYSGRRSVELEPLENTRSGCVARILKVVSGKPLDAVTVQLDNQQFPDRKVWSGFLYPTGLKAIYRQQEIPVYSGNLDRAVELLGDYLDIYGSYAANQPAAPATPATTAVTAPDQTAAGDDSDGGDWYDRNRAGTFYYSSGCYGGYYFIGPSYLPVRWWRQHHPRPPQPPHPPRPPHRPDHPYRPDRPQPRPDGGTRPERPERPERPGDRPTPGVPQPPYRPISPKDPNGTNRFDRNPVPVQPSPALPPRPTPNVPTKQSPFARSQPMEESSVAGPVKGGGSAPAVRRAGDFRRVDPVIRRAPLPGGDGFSSGRRR